jgi:hypothetical protein
MGIVRKFNISERIQFDGNFNICWQCTFSSQTREHQKSEESSARKSVQLRCVTFVGLGNLKYNCTSDYEDGYMSLSLQNSDFTALKWSE